MKIRHKNISIHHSSGMALLDVILAIVIFVVGMLALASLQGNLTRSSADANVRTVGTNIAEELIESLRTIDELRLPDGEACLTDLVDISEQQIYQCIDDALGTVPRAGVNFGVTAAVADWYLLPDGVSVTADPNHALLVGRDTTISNYKIVDILVEWDNEAVAFQGAPNDAPLLGSGSVTTTAIIPSIPNLGAAKTFSGEQEGTGVPLIEYTPGQRPDIVPINLRGSKFKESTTPLPDVIRSDEVRETWFDVVTYNKSNTSTFLRREEFLIVSCECTLMESDGSTTGGLPPTVWEGYEYSDVELVPKAYGVSANNQQSPYCDTCCRDHHDSTGAGIEEVYDPARFASPAKPVWSESGGLDGDHVHYSRSNQGVMSPASYGDDYVEACRLVRKDGFMRVAQDLRQEGFNGFPEGFLDTTTGGEIYSEYVTGAVDDFYASNQDRLDPPADLLFPGGENNPTTIPLLTVNSQQMRSRGVYVDYLTAAASILSGCLKLYEDDYLAAIATDPSFDGPTPGDQCGVPGLTHHLQVLPFYDIQTTYLAWWESYPAGLPVSVTNQAVADDNSHNRGLAVLEDLAATGQPVDVNISMHRGNRGLSVSDKIVEDDTTEVEADIENTYTVHVDVNGGGVGVPPNTYAWSALFRSGVNKVEVSDTVITEKNSEFCARTSERLSCATPLAALSGEIAITGYTKMQGQSYLDLWICISQPAGQPQLAVQNFEGGANNRAVITWASDVAGVEELLDVIISIEDSACP